MSIKGALREMVFGPKASSEKYIAYLRSQGMVIGENTFIYTPRECTIDETRPWMIEIGGNVSITKGVTILTHGYDWSVFKGMYGDVLGSAGRVKIGDNVFIGMNSTILKGVTIGDNVLIGANSLITRMCRATRSWSAIRSAWSAISTNTWKSVVPPSSRKLRSSIAAGVRTRQRASGGGCLRGRFSRSSSGFSNHAAGGRSRASSSRRRCTCAGRKP